MTLQKTWINAARGDSTTLTIDGQPTEEPVVSTASGVASETDEVNTVVADVYAGQTVDLGESLGANKGSYTVNLTCTDEDGLSYEGGYNGEFTMPVVPADVVCTFTNTRTSNALVLQKQWINGNAGDATSLTIVGGLDDPAEATSTSDGSPSSSTARTRPRPWCTPGMRCASLRSLGRRTWAPTPCPGVHRRRDRIHARGRHVYDAEHRRPVPFTNTRTVGDLVIKKAVLGPIAGASTEFAVNVDCSPGTAFDRTGVVLNQANNWTVTISGILSGLSCVVTEPVVPAGWALTSSAPAPP